MVVKAGPHRSKTTLARLRLLDRDAGWFDIYSLSSDGREDAQGLQARSVKDLEKEGKISEDFGKDWKGLRRGLHAAPGKCNTCRELQSLFSFIPSRPFHPVRRARQLHRYARAMGQRRIATPDSAYCVLLQGTCTRTSLPSRPPPPPPPQSPPQLSPPQLSPPPFGRPLFFRRRSSRSKPSSIAKW
eukprot:6198934-Pleurochrysis_carterae.AAC.4